MDIIFVFLLPFHQVAKERQQLSCHLLMLQLAGVPAGSITQVASLEAEVEAVDVFIARLLCFLVFPLLANDSIIG